MFIQTQHTSFNTYMKAPQKKISFTKTQGRKVSKYAPTHPKPHCKKKMSTKSQTINQPGGRAKSNRWEEHNVVSENDTLTTIQSEYNRCDTVTPQCLPTETMWQTRQYKITHY
jgi:hypothetical protein